jgi:hypothetical protein
MSGWTPPDSCKPRRFNLARPRWWNEVVGLALGTLDVVVIFATDLKLEHIWLLLLGNVILFVGGYIVWRPLNYIITKPDRIVIRTWSFSGENYREREIPYEEIEAMGVDPNAGSLWLQIPRKHRWEDDSWDLGGTIILRLSPARRASAAAEAIEEGRSRVRPFLDELDAKLSSARAEAGRWLGYPKPEVTDPLTDEQQHRREQ